MAGAGPETLSALRPIRTRRALAPRRAARLASRSAALFLGVGGCVASLQTAALVTVASRCRCLSIVLRIGCASKGVCDGEHAAVLVPQEHDLVAVLGHVHPHHVQATLEWFDALNHWRFQRSI